MQYKRGKYETYPASLFILSTSGFVVEILSIQW